MNTAFRDELLAMAAEDARVREELARDGSLFRGYHPRMEEVHARNAARLTAILDRHGWPTITLVGGEAEEAAWTIAQHAIAHPPLQRRVLEMLRELPESDAPRWQAAYLEDRIRTLEGRPQLYGTQFDWDEHGQMSPMPIEDTHGVDSRRAAVGLEPMAERIRKMRAGAAREQEQPPADRLARAREMHEWARKVGWRA